MKNICFGVNANWSLVSKRQGVGIEGGLEKSQKINKQRAGIRMSWVENVLKITEKGTSVRDRM